MPRPVARTVAAKREGRACRGHLALATRWSEPLSVGPARRAGRDLRDLRDLRDVAGARLRAMPFASAKQNATALCHWPVQSKCYRAMPFASAKQNATAPCHWPVQSPQAYSLCEAPPPGTSQRSRRSRRSRPRHHPAAAGFAPSQSPVLCLSATGSRLSSHRPAPFQPPALRLSSHRPCAFPVTGLVPFQPPARAFRRQPIASRILPSPCARAGRRGACLRRRCP